MPLIAIDREDIYRQILKNPLAFLRDYGRFASYRYAAGENANFRTAKINSVSPQ